MGKVDVLGYAEDVTFHALAGRAARIPFIKDYMIMFFFKENPENWKGHCYGVVSALARLFHLLVNRS